MNITDINDASGKIEAQGKKAAAESIEKARVAEAMERRNGASGVAEADKLRETEVAQHVAAKDIGIKESDQMQRERIAAIEATVRTVCPAVSAVGCMKRAHPARLVRRRSRLRTKLRGGSRRRRRPCR